MSPQPGMIPTRAWVSANRARSDAIRKSHASAISNPPVTATPFTAPIRSFVRWERTASRSQVVAGAARLARAELLEVDPGAEGGVGAGEDHHVDVDVALELGDDLRKPTPDRPVERVARFGPVERDRRHAVVHVDQHHIAHGSLLLPGNPRSWQSWARETIGYSLATVPLMLETSAKSYLPGLAAGAVHRRIGRTFEGGRQ